MRPALPPIPTLVTGGAGFIGRELVVSLLADGSPVTVLDDFSTSEPDWADGIAGHPLLDVIEGSATDSTAVREALAAGARTGRVVHLAASTDIAGGFQHPERDFAGCVLATHVVCEAMREAGVRELWYASSGVVYGRGRTGGDRAGVPFAEDYGPLVPESHYAAGKLAGEAILSGFAHLYGWRSFAFRFGNTVGPRSNHGVVHDFVVKLLRDPRRLEILGDGTQAKPYVAVADLVEGMRTAAKAAPPRPVTTLNVGPEGTLTVARVAELVIDALGLDPTAVERSFLAGPPGGGGWPGDTPAVSFDVAAIRRLGWTPRFDAERAVRDAARGIAARYREVPRSDLLTASERRVGRVEPQGMPASSGRAATP